MKGREGAWNSASSPRIQGRESFKLLSIGIKQPYHFQKDRTQKWTTYKNTGNFEHVTLGEGKVQGTTGLRAFPVVSLYFLIPLGYKVSYAVAWLLGGLATTALEQSKITMALVNILHMNSGNDDSSYANNSLFQKTVIKNATPFLKRTIKGMANQDLFSDHCFMIADLGCSSGMNTLLVASSIIDTIHEVCQENNRKTPQFQVYLNDLFENDFNNLFKLLPNFYKILKKDKGENFGPCFVSAIPGSFYGRLFPNKSLHLVHSSCSLHWLSQVPKGLEDNKLNIHIAKTSPLNVSQAYGNQFRIDFTNFLQLRSEEMVRGGHMVLTIPSRRTVDPTCDDGCDFWELLTISLIDMLKEGLVQEADINSFNLPFYIPHENELRNIIQADGSFSLDNMNISKLDGHDTDYDNHVKNTTKFARAITEPLFTSHFGKSINEVLFKKFEKNVAEYLTTKERTSLSIVVSLTKKK
ncbi:hypothetical protein L1987_67571 [Smallanthus sonchifolius]|uniref:Uncharacterized protein n=1 Tax=Smallanthus sonchifolius TaxID=185202 RepID=A0ACB9B3W7_9ASTR|nr:hypothetical protein L1987_67571 [Smallanthus sonchifolius]